MHVTYGLCPNPNEKVPPARFAVLSSLSLSGSVLFHSHDSRINPSLVSSDIHRFSAK